MPLKELDLSRCQELENLAPLARLPLVKLNLQGCRKLNDLSPLLNLRLTELILTGCAQVADVSALRDMPLVRLSLGGTRVRDLTPLRVRPLTSLTHLKLGNCAQLSELTALGGMKLKFLGLNGCRRVSNLAPLAGMTSLRQLWLLDTAVGDLTPLAGLQLEFLAFQPGQATKGGGAVREMKTLQEVQVDWGPALKAATFRERYPESKLPR